MRGASGEAMGSGAAIGSGAEMGRAGASAGAPRNPALAAATQAATRITYLNMADCCFGFERIETDAHPVSTKGFYTCVRGKCSGARPTGLWIYPGRDASAASVSQDLWLSLSLSLCIRQKRCVRGS